MKFYNEIDAILRSYEEGKPFHGKGLDWAADRICWAWKFRKITKEQMEELSDRATLLFDSE